MSKKLATTVYITEEQQALLKELNNRSKVPVAEYIRQGIDLVVDRYRDLLPVEALPKTDPEIQRES